jgi:hypothetical protein
VVAKKQSPQQDDTESSVSELKRIANLLALIAVKGETQPQKIMSLTAAGFAPNEIAVLLNTKPNTVSVAIYQNRKKGGIKGSRKIRGQN